MDVTAVRLPDDDEETGRIAFRVDDWALKTWSNKEMSDSLDDWHEESRVEASKIMIDPAISRVLENSGLLLPKQPRDDSETDQAAAAARQQGLQNLVMCQPTPCVTGEDVVYLVARKKFMHPMAWMLAVEMKDGGRLRAVDYSGHLQHRSGNPMYCPSRISKYLKNPATIRVDRALPEVSFTELPGDGDEAGAYGKEAARLVHQVLCTAPSRMLRRVLRSKGREEPVLCSKCRDLNLIVE